jgi:hypothetical protein
VFEINEGVGGPEPLAQLVPGHELARPLEENPQNLERLLGERAVTAVRPQLARV